MTQEATECAYIQEMERGVRVSPVVRFFLVRPDGVVEEVPEPESTEYFRSLDRSDRPSRPPKYRMVWESDGALQTRGGLHSRLTAAREACRNVAGRRAKAWVGREFKLPGNGGTFLIARVGIKGCPPSRDKKDEEDGWRDAHSVDIDKPRRYRTIKADGAAGRSRNG